MLNIMIHSAVLEALSALPEGMRARMYLLVETLSAEGASFLPEQTLRDAELFAVRAGDLITSRTLYTLTEQDTLYLLLLLRSRQSRGERKRASNAAEARKNYLESTRLLPVTLETLRKTLLDTPEAECCYWDAVLEHDLQELINEMRQRAGLSSAEIARKLEVIPATTGRLENNPLCVSVKALARYAAACGAEIDIRVKWPEV